MWPLFHVACSQEGKLYGKTIFRSLVPHRIGAHLTSRLTHLSAAITTRYLCLSTIYLTLSTISASSQDILIAPVTPQTAVVIMPPLVGPFPRFYRNPIQYCRWAAHEKPAIWYSILIGVWGPILLVAGPPTKKAFGWTPRTPIPMTYPGMNSSFRHLQNIH